MHKVEKSPILKIYITIFGVSGFAGLIYESIWSHYLKLFLGHAAYAQTLVLIIFMGGMALGAWLVSRYSERLRNLLIGYALVEGLIGLLALGFHPAFIETTDFAYTVVIPHLASGAAANTCKWLLGALLILPQSVLLGATFPLMSAGIIRRFPARPGHALAVLYFANSLGAAAGVLVSGFVLLALVGLPGTIRTAGVVNLLLAALIWWLASDEVGTPMRRAAAGARISGADDSHGRRVFLGYLACAALTGAASFMYEIGWIRMLNLVLGSATHAFELMLSAFILGLALGGFWIRQRIDTLSQPARALGFIQIAMGVLALGTLLLYGETFELMRFAMSAFAKTDQGYGLFNIYSHGLAMLIMLPATICAGMTLPLITYILVGKGYGEGSIGAVYAANTFGAIVGVVLAVQVIMPAFGLKQLVVAGGGIDVLLGLALLWFAGSAVKRARWAFTAAAALAIVAVSAGGIRLDPIKMASGVYLHGRIRTDREILFHKDGKTASIDLFRSPGFTVISTNGKTEAAIGDGWPSKDEPTMVVVAALPLALHAEAKTVAVIGLGSGLTTHTLLHMPTLTSVDTIEIEPAMVEGARGFGERVGNTFSDPRSRIHIEDAKAFFTNQRKTYDVIISEPSNPWVSGVAGLFSEEFYRLIRNHLNDDGLLVQWLHLYHIDTRLVASVLKALSAGFNDYAIYALNSSDIAIVATRQGTLGSEIDGRLFSSPALAEELAYLGIRNPQDLMLRKIGGRRALDPLFHSFAIRANSDFFPVLDLGATRTRFLDEDAWELPRRRAAAAPLLQTLEGDVPPQAPLMASENFYFAAGARARQARAGLAYFRASESAGGEVPAFMDNDTLGTASQVLAIGELCEPPRMYRVWLPRLHDLADVVLPFLSAAEMEVIWRPIRAAPCRTTMPDAVEAWLNLYEAIGQRDFEGIRRHAEALLPAGEIAPSGKNDYLLMAAMLAHIAGGDHDAALSLWDRYQRPEVLPIELRLLAAHALRGAGRAAGPL